MCELLQEIGTEGGECECGLTFSFAPRWEGEKEDDLLSLREIEEITRSVMCVEEFLERLRKEEEED